MLETVRCEVLNVTYEPLQPVNVKRGIRLVLDGKATLLEEHPTLVLRSAGDIFPVPTRIVLHTLVKTRNPHTPAALTRRNLLLRDSYTCQYCGRHDSELKAHEEMTRDHIHPQDKGGQDVWKNVVLACNSCNNKKANYLLHEIGMTLKKEPYIPTIFEMAMRFRYERSRRAVR